MARSLSGIHVSEVMALVHAAYSCGAVSGCGGEVEAVGSSAEWVWSVKE